MAMAAALLILMLVAPAAHAVQHVVGGSSGWSPGVDYSTWATSETFKVGDTLWFQYDSTHGLEEVSESDYNGCHTNDPLKTYYGGQSLVNLNKPGPMYFLCPTLGFCQGGMKLVITVEGPPNPPPSPPVDPEVTVFFPKAGSANFGNMNHMGFELWLLVVVAVMVSFVEY